MMIPAQRRLKPHRTYRPHLDPLPASHCTAVLARCSPHTMDLFVAGSILHFISLDVAVQVQAVLATRDKNSSRENISVPVEIGAKFRELSFPTFPMWRVLEAAVDLFSDLPGDAQAEWVEEVHVLVTTVAREAVQP